MNWWGEFEFKSHACRHWRLGPLDLWVTRRTHEWQVGYRWSNDPLDETIELREDVDLPEGVELSRYLFSSGGRTLRVLPRVADRPVVSRPEMPVIIPPREQATLYMASPVWVELAAGDRLAVFASIPAWRASSTWFGEDTSEGTLCYATRTRARLDVGGVRRGPRVTTAVFVSNEHREPLRVERLALPLPQMSVFRAADGRLWTEGATVAYDPAVKAPAKIDSRPPREAGQTTRVSGPREDPRANLLARAFSAAIRGVTG
ncbi:MAG: hypothetical protein R6X02_12315 [Enhygromyxa sp.]